MTDPLTDAYLDAIEQRLTEGRIVNMVAQRALLAEVRRLRAMEQRVREYARSIRYVDGKHYAIRIYEALEGGQ